MPKCTLGFFIIYWTSTAKNQHFSKQTNEHVYSSLVDVIFTLFYNKVTNIKNEKKEQSTSPWWRCSFFAYVFARDEMKKK